MYFDKDIIDIALAFNRYIRENNVSLGHNSIRLHRLFPIDFAVLINLIDFFSVHIESVRQIILYYPNV